MSVAQYLVDQMPMHEEGEEQYITKLREKLQELLRSLRDGAEGAAKKNQ